MQITPLGWGIEDNSDLCAVTHEGVLCSSDIYSHRVEHRNLTSFVEESAASSLQFFLYPANLISTAPVFIGIALALIVLLSSHTTEQHSRKSDNMILGLLVVACGASIGAAMALYQLMLNLTCDALWIHLGNRLQQDALVMHSLIPPLMLGLSGALSKLIPNGSAPLFVAAVLNNEPISWVRGVFGVSLVSIIAIASGGSAGPEGPVLPIGGAFGTFFSRFHRQLHQLQMADFVLVGGCASIAAFFDDPLSGCIFVMEVPHMYGMQRYRALPAALVASSVSCYVHRLLMKPMGIGYSPRLRPSICNSLFFYLPLSLLMGLLAAAMARLYIRSKKALDAVPISNPIVRGVTFGAIVALIGLNQPWTLMWGEAQVQIISYNWDDAPFYLTVYDQRVTGAFYMIVLGCLKCVAMLFTTASGYSAGIVFPLVYVGVCIGTGLGNLLAVLLSSPVIGAVNEAAILKLVMAGSPIGESSALYHEFGHMLGHCLGSGFLASVMHAPLGTTLLIQRMAGGASAVQYPLLCAHAGRHMRAHRKNSTLRMPRFTFTNAFAPSWHARR